MATNFKLKRSAVASKRPGTTDLELGELALNTYDGFLYSETTGAGSTVSLLTPWQEKYGQGSIYYSGGKVGIGTTDPDVDLHIQSNSPVIKFSDGAQDSQIRADGGNLKFISDGITKDFIFQPSIHDTTEIARITGDGKVGIATASPDTELDVNGDVTFRTANGNNILFDKSDNALELGKDVKIKLYENFQIYRDNNHGFIDHVGGSALKIRTDILRINDIANDHSMIHADRDSSVKLFFDNSKRLETSGVGVTVTGLTTTSSLAVSGIATFLSAASFLDNDVLYFGGSSSTGISTDYRLRIYSDGTDSYISEATGAGDLRLSSDSRVEIRNAALNHTVASFNTGVGVTVFDRFKVSGISSFTGNVDLGISTSTTITATSRFDSDLVPSTDVARDLGSSSLRWRTLYVSNLVVAPGGPGFAGSNLTVNNLKVIGISTFLGPLNVAGVSTFTNNVHLLDGDKLQLGGTAGTVDGLELYHESGHSYIDDTGSGNLKVRSNNLRISNGGESKVYATFTPTVVDLYADNSVRLTTSGAGVTVTGIITATTGHFDSVTGPSTITIDPATIGDNTGTVVIKGDLQVDGTTTTVNSETLTVTDKNIEIAKGQGNDAAVDGAGITVDSTQGDKTWNWVDATDSWTSSEHIRVAADKVFGFANDPNTFIDGDGNDTINLTTNGSKRVSVTGIGSVGIGSTMPAATVDIQAVSSSYPTLNLGGGGSNNGDLTVNSDETLQIGHFNRNLSTFEERMRISSAGNVGIGSTIPEAKLSVVGIGSFKEDVYIDKKLYVGGIEIGGPGGPGIGTDITTRHLRATGITTTEQLLDADGGADIAGITTVSGLLDANGGADIAGITTTADIKVSAGSSITIPNDNDNTALYLGNFTTPSASGSTGARLRQNTTTNTSFEFNNLFNTGRNFYFNAPSAGGTLFYVSDNATIGAQLYCGGNNLKLQTVGAGITVYGTTETQTLNVTGVSTFVSFLDVNDTTQSSDKDTGSIITEGGVGIEKNLNVGGIINSSTDVQINGTSVVDTALNDAVAMAIALG